MRPVLEEIVFKSLCEHDRDWLEGSFSEEEMKDAVWSCDGNRSVGLDGYSFEFFKQNWEDIKVDVVIFVEDFHEKVKHTKVCTSSFLALILKVKNPQALSEYRPICLVGSLHKLLSKLLAARLKKVIGNIVLENQLAFVPGRSIADGVLMINGILDMDKREKRSCVILKVDFKKAYDCVSWNFLRYLLTKMGFGDRWLRWMEGSVFTS